MKNYARRNFYKRFMHILWSIITGRASMRSIVSFLSLLAVLALGHISLQIYSAKLRESISEMKKERFVLLEKLNDMRSERIKLSSRRRVIDYCERELGMVKAGSDAVVRVAVESSKRAAPAFADTQGSKSRRARKTTFGPASTQAMLR